LFQIGFLEILIILILGLVIIGPKRLPVVVKNVLKFYRRIQNKFSNFRRDFEEEIGSEEINKDVFNELRMEELKEEENSNNND
jgi:twin arginine-targeting protein translocase TatB